MQSYGAAERDGSARFLRKRSAFVFITARPILSDCLIQAIETEFPEVEVIQSEDVQSACKVSDFPVPLIFVDLSLFHQLDSWAPDLMQAHPSAMIALVQTDSRRSVPIEEILHSNVICGVLQMHVKLDIWLAVIRLLLIGGEYLPTALLRPLLAGKIPAPQATRPNAHPPGHDQPGGLGGLTERELQILELVARGLQNKVIAAALQLSEHTVKIHLHNIITKLGTSNRTQAAAIFHRSRGQDADGMSAPNLLSGR